MGFPCLPHLTSKRLSPHKLTGSYSPWAIFPKNININDPPHTIIDFRDHHHPWHTLLRDFFLWHTPSTHTGPYFRCKSSWGWFTHIMYGLPTLLRCRVSLFYMGNPNLLWPNTFFLQDIPPFIITPDFSIHSICMISMILRRNLSGLSVFLCIGKCPISWYAHLKLFSDTLSLHFIETSRKNFCHLPIMTSCKSMEGFLCTTLGALKSSWCPLSFTHLTYHLLFLW